MDVIAFEVRFRMASEAEFCTLFKKALRMLLFLSMRLSMARETARLHRAMDDLSGVEIFMTDPAIGVLLLG